MQAGLSPKIARGTSTQIPCEQMEPLDHALIFDNAIVGICFMRDRHFVQANRRMEEIFGYAPGELFGKCVSLLYASEEDYEAVGRMYATMSRSNRYVHEKAMRRKNGELRWCLISGRKVDPEDLRGASVWVVQDITEKRQAELSLERANQRLEQTVQARTLNLQLSNRALRQEVERRRAMEREMLESREKYRVLFRNIPLGIAIIDSEGQAVEINRTLQQLTGTSSLETFLEAANEANRVAMADGARSSLLQFMSRIAPPDGRRIERHHISWCSLDQPPIEVDVVGVRLHVRGLAAAFTFEDVSERRRARVREMEGQERLAHQGRLALMGQFASALTHELGQPLNACQSYVAGIRHRLEREALDAQDLQEGIDRMSLHLDQATNIVRNVRSFVGRHRPDDAQVEMSELVQQTLELLALQLRTAAVKVEVSLPETAAFVRGNSIEIQQVLVNLVMNAIEAMRDAGTTGSRIEIRIARQGRTRIAVSVGDNGPGIAAERSAEIFEPYHTSKPRGLGMGLSICRTIVESHGGALKLVSAAPGETLFRFSLPVYREIVR